MYAYLKSFQSAVKFFISFLIVYTFDGKHAIGFGNNSEYNIWWISRTWCCNFWNKICIAGHFWRLSCEFISSLVFHLLNANSQGLYIYSIAGLLHHLLPIKWTEPALAEILAHYLDALGPFLKHYPDGVADVINKLFDLLTSLPFSLKVELLFLDKISCRPYWCGWWCQHNCSKAEKIDRKWSTAN